MGMGKGIFDNSPWAFFGDAFVSEIGKVCGKKRSGRQEAGSRFAEKEWTSTDVSISISLFISSIENGRGINVLDETTPSSVRSG